MARDLNLPAEVVICPTLRDPDGFALSSRNIYLSDNERAAAPVLYKALNEAARLLKEDGATPEVANKKMQSILKDEPLVAEVQYIGCYDPASLKWLEEFKGKALLAGAIKIGSTRLIDNIVL
jgi:pantoate--beta-alanine ligase